MPGVGDIDAQMIPGYAEYLADQRAARAKELEFTIDCDNWTAWLVFAACATQWRIGMAGRTGLDYTAVQAAMMMMGFGLDPDIFGSVRLLEQGALAAMNKIELNLLLGT